MAFENKTNLNINKRKSASIKFVKIVKKSSSLLAEVSHGETNWNSFQFVSSWETSASREEKQLNLGNLGNSMKLKILIITIIIVSEKPPRRVDNKICIAKKLATVKLEFETDTFDHSDT